MYEPVEVDHSRPKCIIFDIDGTLSHNDGHRGWFDYDKVADDDVVEAVLSAVRAFKMAGYRIMFITGRDTVCRFETMQWLNIKCGLRGDQYTLWMRPEGDTRHDADLKYEILTENIVGKYYPVMAFEDRNSVVKMWREAGIVCAHVAEGDF